MLFSTPTIILSVLVLSTEALSIRGIEGEITARVPAWRRRHLGFESALVAREPQNNNFRNGGGNNNNNFKNNAKSSTTKTTKAAAATSTAKTSSAKAVATSAAPATGATTTNNNNNNNGGNGNNAAAAGGGSACLSANAIQTGSTSDGQNPPVTGQSKSATDAANFINFCAGSTLTNGLQTKSGSCNGIVMGKIPSVSNMVASIITTPSPGEVVKAGTTFTVSVQTMGLAAGSFTNAQATYYAAPQNVNGNGQIIGHTHITVQDLGNKLAATTPPDPQAFVFFKGVNDAGNGNGLLSATVTGGLPAGNYRVCCMNSASNHQPVIMPVAQRGAQDDCTKFTVK